MNFLDDLPRVLSRFLTVKIPNDTRAPDPRREVDQTISATVKGLYSGRGLTADDVATAIHVSHGTIVSRLATKTSWTAREVQALAVLFEVRVADLYSGLDGRFPGPRQAPKLDRRRGVNSGCTSRPNSTAQRRYAVRAAPGAPVRACDLPLVSRSRAA